MARTRQDLTPAELAVDLSRVLTEAGVRHAIGGALALGFHATPRGTLDVDMNVFVAADHPEAVLGVLATNGVDVDVEKATKTIAARGDLFVEHRGCRLDLFFDSIPLHASAAKRVRHVELLGGDVPILSAEDLIVFKLLFNRHKDIADVVAIIEASGGQLDLRYVRHWLVECVGEDDGRTSTWDALSADAPKPD